MDAWLVVVASHSLIASKSFLDERPKWNGSPSVKNTWSEWKKVFMAAQIDLKRVARVSVGDSSNNLGSANTTTAIHGIPNSACQHSTGHPAGAKGTTTSPQLSDFMEILDNSMDNLASTVTNNKMVMDTLVTNNKILTATNAKLIATNSTFAASGISAKPPGSSSARNPNHNLQHKICKKWDIGGFCSTHVWDNLSGHDSKT